MAKIHSMIACLQLLFLAIQNGSGNYVGCFRDAQKRDLPDMNVFDRDNSVSKCIDHCKAKGYTYAGLQLAKRCYCGNEYGKYDNKLPRAGSECDMACTGDSTQICGGKWRNSIWHVSDNQVRISKGIISYFTSWARYRQGIGMATADKIDPTLFTNIIYAFVDWDAKFRMKIYDPTDTDSFQAMNQWRTQNPGIKISVSIGGWPQPAPDGPRAAREFSQMSSNAANRKRFIRSTIRFLRSNELDGVDIDWEYPESNDTTNYINLVKELRAAFNAEASGNSRLLLSAAMPGAASRMEAYGLDQIKNDFDWITIMAYDYHGSWDNNTAHHSSRSDAAASMQNYINTGVPPSRLCLGLPTYGRGNVPPGPITGGAGVWAYYEVRDKILNYSWTVKIHNGGPMASGNGLFLYFDNPQSLAEKTSDAKANDFGAVSFWTVDEDLFDSSFASDRFELTNAVRKAFL